MRAIWVAVEFVVAFAGASAATSADLDLPYTPTRQEWLEVVVRLRVQHAIDYAAARVLVNAVIVTPKAETIYVSVATATGEPVQSSEEEARILKLVHDLVQHEMKKYQWARGIAVKASFAR